MHFERPLSTPCKTLEINHSFSQYLKVFENCDCGTVEVNPSSSWSPLFYIHFWLVSKVIGKPILLYSTKCLDNSYASKCLTEKYVLSDFSMLLCYAVPSPTSVHYLVGFFFLFFSSPSPPPPQTKRKYFFLMVTTEIIRSLKIKTTWSWKVLAFLCAPCQAASIPKMFTLF